jgi:excisionase family DNA binding protein
MDMVATKHEVSFVNKQLVLTVAELAALLRCTPATVRKLDRSGKLAEELGITSFRLGSTVRFPMAQVEAAMAARVVSA